MKGTLITLCVTVILTIGTIIFCYKSNEAEAIEYKNELITAIAQTSGSDWEVIEVRGELMTVEFAKSVIEYIDLSY